MNRLWKWLKARKDGVWRIQSPSELGASLTDRARYRNVFQALETRAQDDRRYERSHALHEEMDLRWVLDNRRRVLGWVLERLRRQDYVVSPARESECRIGEKKRLLYRLEWPDRIVQAVLAQALAECWEGTFHSRLFSYRKGRSAVQAARMAARFVRAHAPGPVYVLKRDVKSYGDSIPHEPLFQRLEETLAGADAFTCDLIRQFIAFRYSDAEGKHFVKHKGLPTGMPLNCVLENIYLAPMDEEIGREPGVSYMRYGDDIWVSTTSIETARKMRKRLDEMCAELGLAWHKEKSFDFRLAAGSRPEGEDEEFLSAPRILHLGVAIDRDGHIDIPPEKLKRWRKELKVALSRADYIGRRLGLDREQRVRHVVHFANQFMESRSGAFPKMDYLLTVVTHDQRFIEIDRWVAQTVQAACTGRFSKSNFRKIPYRMLKECGLKSLYLRRQEMYARAHRRQGGRR